MTQNGIGYRPKNGWGSGDLPAPFAEGDVVRLVGGRHERLDDMTGPFFVVVCATSIDEGTPGTSGSPTIPTLMAAAPVVSTSRSPIVPIKGGTATSTGCRASSWSDRRP